MQKTAIFTLAIASVLSILLLSSVSASSIWEPEYEVYRLGAHQYGNAAYSSVETYEKVTVENEDRFGSDSMTTIKRTESETYTPLARSSSRYHYDYDEDNYYYDDDYNRYCAFHSDCDSYDNDDDVRYIYVDDYGRTTFHDKEVNNLRLVQDWDTQIRYDDGNWYPSSNWRFKSTYDPYDYDTYENEYGYDYYYEPRYDWHLGIFNWRY